MKIDNFLVELENATIEYDLNHNNGYYDIGVIGSNEVVNWVVEAPNNTTLYITFDCEKIKNIEFKDEVLELIHDQFSNAVFNFEPDDTFNELWSKDFGNKNNFTPSIFIEMLVKDKEFFEEVENEMLDKLRLLSIEIESKGFREIINENNNELLR